MFNRRAFIAGSCALFSAASIAEAQASEVADWRLVSAAGGPGARWDHTLSHLPGTSRLMLGFGRDAQGTPLGDVWLADRSDGVWELIDQPGPSARFGHAAAVDSGRDTVYLFGGQFGDTFFADLWAFSTLDSTWERIDDGATGPPARYGTALVHDGNDGLFLLHGFTFSGRFDDVWRFDLESLRWESIAFAPESAPLRRCLHEAVWRRDSSSILLYGGCSSGYGPCPQGDLWEFDPQAGLWRERLVSGPAGRMSPSMVMDDRGERLILFGGLTEAGASDELWIGAIGDDSIVWRALPAEGRAPSARSSHDAVLSGGALYLIGGTGVEGVTGDLWRLKLPG